MPIGPRWRSRRSARSTNRWVKRSGCLDHRSAGQPFRVPHSEHVATAQNHCRLPALSSNSWIDRLPCLRHAIGAGAFARFVVGLGGGGAWGWAATMAAIRSTARRGTLPGAGTAPDAMSSHAASWVRGDRLQTLPLAISLWRTTGSSSSSWIGTISLDHRPAGAGRRPTLPRRRCPRGCAWRRCARRVPASAPAGLTGAPGH